jgi:VIT1/CCC1 family predicted Fe2+/Mn2+ transporter
VVLCVVELASLGAVIARRSRAAPLETLLAMLGCGLLGAILVVLKVLVH